MPTTCCRETTARCSSRTPIIAARSWTSRVWPGAVLLDGEISGTWRRANETVTIQTWGRPSRAARQAVEAEAAALPLPGLQREIVVRWND